MNSQKPASIDQYIAQFAAPIQARLEEMRKVIQKASLQATECINYGIPTFKLDGKILVHFAAFKKHIGFYPGPAGIAAFQKEISAYKNAKGSVQFPLDEPLPLDLIRKIVEFRMRQNLENKS